MNTWIVRTTINTLLNGGYMRRVTTHAGNQAYRLYTGVGIIEGQFRARSVDRMQHNLPHQIFKTDRNGKITIMRQRLQQLHGNYRVKRIYKDFLKYKNDATNKR